MIAVSIVWLIFSHMTISVHQIRQSTKTKTQNEIIRLKDFFSSGTLVCHLIDFSARSFAPSRCRCSRNDFDSVALSSCFDFKQ